MPSVCPLSRGIYVTVNILVVRFFKNISYTLSLRAKQTGVKLKISSPSSCKVLELDAKVSFSLHFVPFISLTLSNSLSVETIVVS